MIHVNKPIPRGFNKPLPPDQFSTVRKGGTDTNELVERVVSELVAEGRSPHRHMYNAEQNDALDSEARAFYRKVIDRYRAAASAEQADTILSLRGAVVALADGADKCAEAPHHIVQPFLGIYREHGKVIADCRAALNPTQTKG